MGKVVRTSSSIEYNTGMTVAEPAILASILTSVSASDTFTKQKINLQRYVMPSTKPKWLLPLLNGWYTHYVLNRKSVTQQDLLRGLYLNHDELDRIPNALYRQIYGLQRLINTLHSVGKCGELCDLAQLQKWSYLYNR